MDRILRLPVVIERSGLKKTAIYEQIEKGYFPKPVPLTVDGRSVGWRESDIAGWIEQRTKEAPQVMGERKRLRQAQAA